MITLGGRSFTGPFMLPLWSASRASGLYAVMVPGWRLLTFRALHFGEAGSLSLDRLRSHPRYGEWLAVAGTEWNLYVATHEMSFSTESQRQAAERDLARDYRPEFAAPHLTAELPGLRALLAARALRNTQG